MNLKDPQSFYPPYKNVAAALLFSVILGPIGLLYSTLRGGIIMVVIGFVVICNRFPVPIILTWIICCIWGVAAANRYNNKLLAVRIRNNNEEKNNSATSS